MTIHDLITGGGGALLVLTSLLQISPIPINPWSVVARAFGRAINGELYKKVDAVEKLLDAHISKDDANPRVRRQRQMCIRDRFTPLQTLNGFTTSGF